MITSQTPHPPSRNRLIDRLESLISSSSSLDIAHTTHESPRSSLDSPSDMRLPRSVTHPGSGSNQPAPVLRWLSNWSPNKQHSRSNSSPSSNSNSRSSSPPSSPAAPDLTLLREALHEPLIARPPAAQLPSSFRPQNLSRPPPFLDNLTRSTLPTSSLSPPLEVRTSLDNVSPSEIQYPPIVLSHSPPYRSSLDTLRRMSLPPSRSMSTLSRTDSTFSTASSFLPSLPSTNNFSWWFSESKDSTTNTQSLLSEEDQQQDLKKKCRLSFLKSRDI